MKIRVRIALVALLSLGTTCVRAEPYPVKPVRILAPSVGGGADTTARYIGQRLTDQWGKSVIVENRPGASATIAANIVAKATPDGYTLLMGEGASMVNAVSMFKTLPYSPVGDFAPVTLVATAPLVFVAHPSVPAQTLAEFIAYAKQRSVNYGSGGEGTASHLTTAMLSQAAGLAMTHVPYKGAGAVLPAVVGGEVAFSSISATTASTQVKAGRLKAYAVTSSHRFANLPDVPTAEEAGLPGFTSAVWFGLFAPAKTSHAIIAKLNHDVGDILRRSDTREAFLARGSVVAPSTPQELGAFLRSEIAKWSAVIRRLPGMKR